MRQRAVSIVSNFASELCQTDLRCYGQVWANWLRLPSLSVTAGHILRRSWSAPALLLFQTTLTWLIMLLAQEIAASYGFGAVGGLVYLRMLQKSVDGIGAGSLGEAAGSAASQPRLLVPIVLVLAANRQVAS